MILGLALCFCGCKQGMTEDVVKPTPNPTAEDDSGGKSPDAPRTGSGARENKRPKN